MQQQQKWQAQWYQQGLFSEQTLPQVIKETLRRYPNSYVALESEVRPAKMSLKEIWQQSEQLASAMSALGIAQGDVVAIQLPNWVEALVICQATQLIGAVMLPMTSLLSQDEVSYILQDSEAKALFIPEQWHERDYCSMITPLLALPNLQQVVVLGELFVELNEVAGSALSWSDFLAKGQNSQYEKSTVNADDVALLNYTSGTTSKPKGVLHSHNSLLCDARNSELFWGDQTQSTYLSPWPFGHIAAMVTFTHIWCHGANTVFADRWEADHVAELVQRHKVGATSGVPYFLQSLLDASQASGIDISSLKNYGTGAVNVPPELVQRCVDLGIHCYRMYGSTEHPTITAAMPNDPTEKCVRTDGRCLPGNQIRILDDEGNDQPTGVDGEVASIGPERCLGYKDQQRNAESFTQDGWFLTGDIGNVDADGFLTITDRKKDIIIRGGENISSREVEECLSSHPAVIEAAAIAMPDSRLGEKICAFVALVAEQTINLEQVTEHFKAQGLAKHKTPEKIIVVSALPRNATGKVLKEPLRAQLSLSN